MSGCHVDGHDGVVLCRNNLKKFNEILFDGSQTVFFTGKQNK